MMDTLAERCVSLIMVCVLVFQTLSECVNTCSDGGQ